MKKFVDDARMIYKCCSLYYEDNLNQQAVADYLGISRASVSRMLQSGKEMGIVKVELCNPGFLTYNQLERELERSLGLKEIIIADTQMFDTEEDKTKSLSECVVRYLVETIQDGDLVGVSMGRTLHNVVKVPSVSDRTVSCTFVPVLGGMSREDPFNVEIHANQIAVNMAKMLGGNCIQFFSPAIFSEASVLRGFMQEIPIRQTTGYFSKLSMVLMGIGETSSVGSTLVLAKYIGEKELQQIAEDGAVGDICLRFFDKNGNMEPFHRFNDRVASITPEDLKRVKTRIGVAGGLRKAAAALGAIRGGFVNVLITDAECAEKMMDLMKQEGKKNE